MEHFKSLIEAKNTLGELKSFFRNKGKIELTIKDYNEDQPFTYDCDLEDFRWKLIGKSAYRVWDVNGALDYTLDFPSNIEKNFKKAFINKPEPEAKQDNGMKTVKDLQGTEDAMYALTPAMEKVFGKGKVKHHWRMEFPSVEGKTPDSKILFGMSIDMDYWKSLSFMVILDNGQMMVKDVAKIKETDTVNDLNTRTYSFKKDLQQEFKDLQTIPGSADEIEQILKDDGYKAIG